MSETIYMYKHVLCICNLHLIVSMNIWKPFGSLCLIN